MVFSVGERLQTLRPVASANAEIDSGFLSLIAWRSARLSSLSTSASDFIEVNQIFSSPGLGLYAPWAIAKTRTQRTPKLEIELAKTRLIEIKVQRRRQ